MNSRLLAALLLLPACSRSPDAPKAAAGVRDSAGVQLVEHSAGSEAQLPEWVVNATPRVDIGGGEGPGQELHQVAGAVRLSDGRIMVADRGSLELRYYDSAGTYLFAAGGRGQGPGDFASLGALQLLPGDSVFVLDGQLRRGSLFSPEGKFARSLTAGVHPTGGARDSYSYATALLHNGRLLGDGHRFLEMKETSGPVRRDPFAVVLLGADGAGTDTIALVPGYERFPALGHEGGQSFPTVHSLEFGRITVTATDGERIYIGTNEADGIRVYDSGGRLIRIIRSATPAEPVTAEQREKRLQENLARIGRQNASEQMKAEWRKNEENPRYADVFPFYERLLTGTDGSLWVERARRYEDEGRRFIVYDSTGRAIARVSCPERMRPYQVGPNEIVGMWRDPDEVQHVRAYTVSGER